MSDSLSESVENVPLTATVTSNEGVVNEGSETFSLLSGATIIGNPVTVSVSAGAANAVYALPASTPAGTYVIKAVYNSTLDFLGYTDMSHSLVVNAASSVTAADNDSTTFSTASQGVPLLATITSAVGTVNEGTETFTILSDTAIVGTPVTVSVTAGAAAANYVLPASTPAGTYVIEAVYNGTNDFLPFTDTSHALTVSAESTVTTAASASATFSASSQAVSLSATVTSTAGTVNEGTETFTILIGTTVIGSPVTVNVTAGGASAGYDLPADTLGGTYTIEAVYNGTLNFGDSSDSTHLLTISAATSATAAPNATATFNTTGSFVSLSATITSSAGTGNEGTETFTILTGTTVIGSPVTVNVIAGVGAASYSLPGETSPGTYVIDAVFNGTGDFLGSFGDTSHSLVISAAATSTAAVNAFTIINAAAQTVPLNATVTSAAGTLNEGTETFTILNGTTIIGSPVTVNVAAGAASASYVLPAGTSVGTYTIDAVSNGTSNFLTATDTSHTLIVSVPVNVTGLWEGTLYQPGSPVPSYPYDLDLVQTNQSVNVSSLIEIPNESQYYGEATLTGSVSADVFTYQENTFLAQNPLPGYYWLLIAGDLQESPDGNSLTGTWSGGTISLTRASASPATILPTDLTLDATQGGVDFGYQVTYGPGALHHSHFPLLVLDQPILRSARRSGLLSARHGGDHCRQLWPVPRSTFRSRYTSSGSAIPPGRQRSRRPSRQFRSEHECCCPRLQPDDDLGRLGHRHLQQFDADGCPEFDRDQWNRQRERGDGHVYDSEWLDDCRQRDQR